MNKKKIAVEQIKKLATADDLELYSYVTVRAESVAGEIIDLINMDRNHDGGIIFVYGPQNAGKTIIACIVADELGDNGKQIIATQPDVDRPDVPKDRYFSRSGVERKVESFKTKSQLSNLLSKSDVLIVDEVQFVNHKMQSYFLKDVMDFVERGGWLIALGCLYTAQEGEFLLPAILKERATKSYEITSTCQKCGARGARLNQRLVNGKPTSINDPELLSPSEDVSYEPRCDECHVIFG